MIKLQFFVSLLLFCLAPTIQADQSLVSIEHDGYSRTYHLYVPSRQIEGLQSPLLIALHGRTSNGERMAQLTEFNRLADQKNFIVAYPDGIDNQWNYLHGLSGPASRPNDSEFLLALIDDIRGRQLIDPGRIYVTGISNGGFMAQRLACYAPRVFAAYASVAAGGYALMDLKCKRETPINMLYIHGTADELIPWRGLGIEDENGNRQRVTMSILDSVRFWSDRNQCGSEVRSQELLPAGNSPGTHVKILKSTQCANNAEVVLFAIIGGGHNWPGRTDFISPRIAGRVNMDIHASDVIWSFFDTKFIAP